MKKTAKELRKEDPKQWTQAALAKMFGVGRETVRDWFQTSTSNGGSANTCKPKAKPKPDARVKITEAAQEKAYSRVKAGESQAQVAADRSTVSLWLQRGLRKKVQVIPIMEKLVTPSPNRSRMRG